MLPRNIDNLQVFQSLFETSTNLAHNASSHCYMLRNHTGANSSIDIRAVTDLEESVLVRSCLCHLPVATDHYSDLLLENRGKPGFLG